jgi:alanine racemase
MSTLVPAQDPADALMKKLLDAVKANAYDAYLADATPRMKASGRSSFGVASAHIAPLLLKGYKTTFLTNLRKTDHSVHLWKLEPAGAPEDYEIRLVMRDGKVDAFAIE